MIHQAAPIRHGKARKGCLNVFGGGAHKVCSGGVKFSWHILNKSQGRWIELRDFDLNA
jgi:hypothetical protein